MVKRQTYLFILLFLSGCKIWGGAPLSDLSSGKSSEEKKKDILSYSANAEFRQLLCYTLNNTANLYNKESLYRAVLAPVTTIRSRYPEAVLGRAFAPQLVAVSNSQSRIVIYKENGIAYVSNCFFKKDGQLVAAFELPGKAEACELSRLIESGLPEQQMIEKVEAALSDLPQESVVISCPSNQIESQSKPGYCELYCPRGRENFKPPVGFKHGNLRSVEVIEKYCQPCPEDYPEWDMQVNKCKDPNTGCSEGQAPQKHSVESQGQVIEVEFCSYKDGLANKMCEVCGKIDEILARYSFGALEQMSYFGQCSKKIYSQKISALVTTTRSSVSSSADRCEQWAGRTSHQQVIRKDVNEVGFSVPCVQLYKDLYNRIEQLELQCGIYHLNLTDEELKIYSRFKDQLPHPFEIFSF